MFSSFTSIGYSAGVCNEEARGALLPDSTKSPDAAFADCAERTVWAFYISFAALTVATTNYVVHFRSSRTERKGTVVVFCSFLEFSWHQTFGDHDRNRMTMASRPNGPGICRSICSSFVLRNRSGAAQSIKIPVGRQQVLLVDEPLIIAFPRQVWMTGAYTTTQVS